MIVSQSKVNDLLKVFENPKNIEQYNISYQKQEVENASKFINDYHLYGSPKLHQQTISINNQPQNIKTISRTQSINSQNQPINGQSIILSNNVQNLQNYEDVEIHHSITNLKNGQKEYNQKTAEKYIQQKNSIYPRHSQYPKYNPTTQSISSYEYQKNDYILNSLLKNSSKLPSISHYNPIQYSQTSYKNYNNDYLSPYNKFKRYTIKS